MSNYTSHFSIKNIPYGIASSSTRPRQCVTRIGDDVIFLAELADKGIFKDIQLSPALKDIFGTSTLNTFAAVPKEVHARVRSAIQSAFEAKQHQSSSENIKDVMLHLPVQIGDFTDFSASANHVQNAAEAMVGKRSMPPAFLKYPVCYAGRCSSISLSGTLIKRPLGQFIEDYTVPEPKRKITFGASRALDYELEVGAVIGRPVEPGVGVKAKDADEHIFGLVLVNDWSSRDIQGLEMNPLGPFNGKNFVTSISPWVITLEALQSFQTPAPNRMGPVAEFLDDPKPVNYSIHLEVEVERKGVKTTTCKVNFNTMYWTFRHMLAHHTVGGCGLRTGDLVASGTVSGEADHEHGCLLELTMNGRNPVTLSDGSEMRYLQDGDIVRLTGAVGDTSSGIGFGECVGVVAPARKF